MIQPYLHGTIYKGGVASDDRGSVRFVNDFSFKDVKRFYQVENVRAGFVRAWHGHMKEGKYVYVPKGTALIGVCPIFYEKNGQENIMPPEKFVLASSNPTVLWIPPGHANGVQTLTDDTIVMFFSTTSLEESTGDDYRFPWDLTSGHKEFWEEKFR